MALNQSGKCAWTAASSLDVVLFLAALLAADAANDDAPPGRSIMLRGGALAADIGRAQRLQTRCPKSIVAAPTMSEDDRTPRDSSGRPRLWLLPGTDRRGAPQPLPRRSGRRRTARWASGQPSPRHCTSLCARDVSSEGREVATASSAPWQTKPPALRPAPTCRRSSPSSRSRSDELLSVAGNGNGNTSAHCHCAPA